jgi:hypothetical protein
METNDWGRTLEQLRVPFLPEIVSWKPQTVTRDRRRCLAVPYVETQPYQDRLDDVCPDWQDDYAIWFSDPQETAGRMGEKRTVPGKVFVKCRLVIDEHTRADVGECELTDENAFTTAKAQAFKRACASFGLGRYLYDLPKVWVDFDEDKGIPEGELKKLEAALRRRAGTNGNAATVPTNGTGSHAAGPTNGSVHATAPVSEPAAVTVKEGGQTSAAAKDSGQANSSASGSTPASTNGKGRASASANEKAGSTNGSGHAPAVAEATLPTARSEAAAAAVLNATETATTATDEQPLCPLHHVPLQLVITRDGKSHLLHRIEGEGYCNGEVVRALRQN